MTQYVINIGAIPNDGTGDPLRTAFNETNLNFDQVFAAGPVLSNVQIANNTILTTNTNGNLILAPNGIGIVQSNVSIVPNLANIRNLGSADRRWATVYVQYANITGGLSVANLTATGNVTVGGNLSVTGNIIYIGNLITDAKTIQLANTAGTANAADGSGITVGANDAIATMLYSSADNAWAMNIGLNTPNIVVNNISSDDSTFVTVQDGLDVQGSITAETLSVTGNVTGNYFIGNGSQLTGLPAGYANANAVAYGQVGWAGNIVPAVSNTYSLGNSSLWWSNIWVAGNTIYIGGVSLGMGAGNVLTVGGNAVLQNNSNSTISTTGNITADYFFGNGSRLTGLSTSSISNGLSNVNIPTANGNVTVTANGTYAWTFGADGATIFPTLSVTRGDRTGTLTGFTINIGDGTNEALITTPNGVDGSDSQRLVINPGAGSEFGEGGDIYLYSGRGGASGGSGGDIKIRGGLGPIDGAGGYIDITGGEADGNGAGGYIDILGGQSANSAGGYVRIIGGQGTTGGDANITGGVSTAGPGGAVNITGGTSSNGLAEYGNVNISSGTSTWRFDNTGNLTVPNIIQGSGDSDYVLKLGAFPEETAAGRWLQVRSGDVADHIHFDTSNNSAWNFYLGSDNQYVLIGNTGNISIGSYDSGNNTTYQWTFDNTSNLTLPQGGVVYETPIPFGGLEGNTIALKPSGGTDVDQQLLVYPTAGTDFNHLHLTSGNLYNTELFLGNDNLYVKLANTGDIVINTNDDGGNTAQWTFGTDANLSVPGNTLIYTPIATGGAGGNNITIQAGSSDSFSVTPGGNLNLIGGYGSFGDGGGPPGGNVNITSGGSYDSHAGNVTINAGSSTWTFDYNNKLSSGPLSITSQYGLGNTGTILEQDGTLELIGNGTGCVVAGWNSSYGTTGNVAQMYFNPADSTGNIVVTTGNTAGTSYEWTFDKTGNLTVPGNLLVTGNIQPSAEASPAPSLTGFSSVSAANLSASGNVTGGNLITTGSAGNITLTGGNITGANVITANVVSATGNITGNYILGNGSQLTGLPATYGNANVSNLLASFGSNTISTSGNVTAGNIIGNINITGNVQGTTANVTLVAGAYSTVFDNTGNLTLPGNTFSINYANGTQVPLGGGSAYNNSNVATFLAAYGSNTVSTSGNITAGNFIGNGAALTNVTVSIAGNVVGPQANVGIVAGSYSTVFDNTGVATFPGTVKSSGNTNATAFAVVGNDAVSNVALGFFPTGNTPAEMAIRDYSTANSTMYFDTTAGSANTGGSFKFRGSNTYTNYANINQYGVQTSTAPAFRVYGNGVTGVSSTTNTTGILNGNNWAVDYNQGSYLNLTTGVFTAPVAGLYQVNLVARVANNVAPQAQAVVVKNEATTASNQVMWEVAANCTVNHFGVSTVSKLAVGDTLSLKVTVGALTFDVNDNWSVAFLG